MSNKKYESTSVVEVSENHNEKKIGKDGFSNKHDEEGVNGKNDNFSLGTV